MRDFNEMVIRFRDNEYNNLGVMELVELYKQTNDELYLGSLIYNLRAFIYKWTSKYPTLESADLASIILECLFRSVQRWDKERGSFLTFFGRNLNGDLVCMLESQLRKKNVFNREAYSLDKMEEDINFLPSYNQEIFSVASFAEQCDLDELETEIVKMLDCGYKIKDMVKLFNTSKNIIDEYILSIRQKIKQNYEYEGFTL